MSAQHSADAAGGEAVYSSDALPPLPVPPPPPFISKRTENDILDSDSIPPPSQAIETFRNRHGGETRLEKLERIKRELMSLEQEHDMEDTMATSERVKELQVKLDQLLVGNSMKQLTAKLEPSSTSQKPTESSTTTNASLLEERLLRIEQTLGHSLPSTTSASIYERLRKAEETLENINEKKLSQAASRAKVIRADLEAAAKARSKLNTNAQDSAKISKLYNQMTELDGFLTSDSHILSAIVDRLTACSELHRKSMDFARNLESLETTVVDVKALLDNLETTVDSVDKKMDENMKVLQSNMETLDEKFAGK